LISKVIEIALRCAACAERNPFGLNLGRGRYNVESFYYFNFGRIIISFHLSLPPSKLCYVLHCAYAIVCVSLKKRSKVVAYVCLYAELNKESCAERVSNGSVRIGYGNGYCVH